MNKKIIIFSTLISFLATNETYAMKRQRTNSIDQNPTKRQKNNQSMLLSLPQEIKEHIAEHLSWENIRNLRRTCNKSAQTFVPHKKPICLQDSTEVIVNKLQLATQPQFATNPLGLIISNNSSPNNVQRLFAVIIQKNASHRIIVLNLENNHLSQLPEEIGHLKNLKYLDLSTNNLNQQEIRKIVTSLPQLEVLNLGDNNLSQLPSEIDQLKKLKQLDLSNNNLNQEEIRKICSLHQLEKLNLFDNVQLDEHDQPLESQLPSEIAQLQQLKHLGLSPYALNQEEIRKICSLSQLERLDLAWLDDITQMPHSFLLELPQEIGQLEKLKYLNLLGNLLNPQEIIKICTSLPRLKKLNLADTGISELPQEIVNLQNLKELDISGNSLNPQEIIKVCTSLPQLEVLDLRSNNLSQLPPEIGQLQKLQRLNLWNNNFSQEMKETMRQWLPNTEIRF